MKWNWQQKDWPNFTYNASVFSESENFMNYNAGMLFGAFKHLSDENKNSLKVEIIANEALKTSEIEGEYLNRDSLQSSILSQFGLNTDNRRIKPAEKGISELMVDLYNNYIEPLSHQSLYRWHKMLIGARVDLVDIGCYRRSNEPMQIISGSIHNPKIHFEAVPASQVFEEMDRFIKWFNDTAPTGKSPLSAIIRASIAHLYFESIHPFEDGNGRIGRVIAEKSMSQTIGQPTLVALATMIEKDKRAYYDALEQVNKNNEITKWIQYFAKVILDAQQYTQIRIEFLIKKTKFYESYQNHLNERQKKAIERMFREGPEGFAGGLSAENYIRITQASRPTATRDLYELFIKKVFIRTGEKKSTRYYLNV
jgi:Fic family protein